LNWGNIMNVEGAYLLVDYYLLISNVLRILPNPLGQNVKFKKANVFGHHHVEKCSGITLWRPGGWQRKVNELVFPGIKYNQPAWILKLIGIPLINSPILKYNKATLSNGETLYFYHTKNIFSLWRSPKSLFANSRMTPFLGKVTIST